MRTREEVDFAKMARLFSTYLDGGAFQAANAGNNEMVSFLRTLPWEGSVEIDEYVEVLDYEKAGAIVDATDRFAMGICGCRHQRRHLGENSCKAPLDNCSVFGPIAVDWMVRNGFGREVSKAEMLANISAKPAQERAIDILAQLPRSGLIGSYELAWDTLTLTVIGFDLISKLCQFRSRTALIALIWLGVVPQQPPMMLAPALENCIQASANSDGLALNMVRPSSTVGKPAFG
jgi:hypothetical protein